MNDLAEKALQGLDVARRQVRDRPMLSLAVVGFLVSAAVVVTGGRAGATRASRGLTTWLGLDNPRGAKLGDVGRASLMLAAVVVLIALWLLALEVIRRTRQPESRVWWLVAAWTTPFALGPPLMDTSVYTSAAFGLIQRAGHNPYDVTPSSLGHASVVAAIEPGQRGVPSSAGPLGSLLQHLAVSASGGGALGAVIALRVLGVLAAIAIGRLAADIGGRRGGEALALTGLNPLVLLYVVSSPHLDGAMVAVGLGAVVAADQRRWLRSVALACVAGSISGQGFVLVPIIVTVHCLGRRTAPLWKVLGRDVLVAAAVTVAAGLVQPGGFGWLRTVSKQFSVNTPYAVASGIGQVLSPIVEGASYDDLAASGRITAMTAAVCTIVYLVATARHRSLERTAGYALLALGLLAPSLNPWYLLWGTLFLAPTAVGIRRTWVLALCSAACVLAPVGFAERTGQVVTAVALGTIAVGITVVLVQDHRRTMAASGAISAEG